MKDNSVSIDNGASSDTLIIRNSAEKDVATQTINEASAIGSSVTNLAGGVTNLITDFPNTNGNVEWTDNDNGNNIGVGIFNVAASLLPITIYGLGAAVSDFGNAASSAFNTTRNITTGVVNAVQNLFTTTFNLGINGGNANAISVSG